MLTRCAGRPSWWVGRPNSTWRFAVPVVVALAGFAFVVSAVEAGGVDLRASHEDLAPLIGKRQRQVADLDAAAAELRARIAQDTRSRSTDDPRIIGERSRADALLAPAGLTAVAGPAVTVVLDDAPPQARTRPRQPGVPSPVPDDLVVHQQDVQAVVNALWSGGGEAMTIMGQRVTALTAVRCVGNTLLLAGKVYSPPFTVSAIGDTASMVRALDVDSGVGIYRQYVDAYGLGYHVEIDRDVRLPAYQGGTVLRAATSLPR